MSDAAMLRALAVLSFVAVWGVAAVSIVMGRWLLRRRGAEMTWPAAVAVVLATLGCYPLIKGYSLGNAQTFLSVWICGDVVVVDDGAGAQCGGGDGFDDGGEAAVYFAAGVDAGAKTVGRGVGVCGLRDGAACGFGCGVWVAQQSGLHWRAGGVEP